MNCFVTALLFVGYVIPFIEIRTFYLWQCCAYPTAHLTVTAVSGIVYEQIHTRRSKTYGVSWVLPLPDGSSCRQDDSREFATLADAEHIATSQLEQRHVYQAAFCKSHFQQNYGDIPPLDCLSAEEWESCRNANDTIYGWVCTLICIPFMGMHLAIFISVVETRRDRHRLAPPPTPTPPKDLEACRAG